MTADGTEVDGDLDDEKRPMILVVDDEPEAADRYAELLTPTFEVRVAYSGRAALDKLDSEVDVVFLDREMPDLHGDEVLERFRQQGFDVPVAMVTGVGADIDIADLPFDDYIQKPTRGEELREKAAELLQRTEYADEYRELFAASAKEEVLNEGDGATQTAVTNDITDPGTEGLGVHWDTKVLRTLLGEVEGDVPAPGVTGGWKSTGMVQRLVEEEDFIENKLSSGQPLPGILSETAADQPKAPAHQFLAEKERALDPLQLAAKSSDGMWASIKYRDAAEQVANIARGFACCGVGDGRNAGDNVVAVIASVRAEASLAIYGVQAAGGVVGSIDPDAPTTWVRRVLNHLQPDTIVFSDESEFKTHSDAILAARTNPETVVVCDPFNPDDNERASDIDATVLNLDGLVRKGRTETVPERIDELAWDALDVAISLDSPAAIAPVEATPPEENADPEMLGMLFTHANLWLNAAQMQARLGTHLGGDTPGGGILPSGAPDGRGDASITPDDNVLVGLPPWYPAIRILGYHLPTMAGATIIHAASTACYGALTASGVDLGTEMMPDDVTFDSDAPTVAITEPVTFEWIAEVVSEQIADDTPLVDREDVAGAIRGAARQSESDEQSGGGLGSKVRGWIASRNATKAAQDLIVDDFRLGITTPRPVRNDVPRWWGGVGVGIANTFAPAIGGMVGLCTPPEEADSDSLGRVLFGGGLRLTEDRLRSNVRATDNEDDFFYPAGGMVSVDADEVLDGRPSPTTDGGQSDDSTDRGHLALTGGHTPGDTMLPMAGHGPFIDTDGDTNGLRTGMVALWAEDDHIERRS